MTKRNKAHLGGKYADLHAARDYLNASLELLTGRKRQKFMLPGLFLLRHSVELSLKEAACFAGAPTFGAKGRKPEAPWDSHRLSALIKAAAPFLSKAIGSDRTREVLDPAKRAAKWLDQVERGDATRLRYDVDLLGAPNFNSKVGFDLDDLIDACTTFHELTSGDDGVCYELHRQWVEENLP